MVFFGIVEDDLGIWLINFDKDRPSFLSSLEGAGSTCASAAPLLSVAQRIRMDLLNKQIRSSMQALQDVASSNVDDGGLVGQRLVQLRGVAEGEEEIVRRRRRRRGGGGGKDRDGQYSLGKPAPICVQRSPSGFDSHTISLLLVVVFLFLN
jgi:hypothetical protein